MKLKEEMRTKLQKENLRGLEIRGTASECESGVLTVTGALRLHDTWHVSSPAVSRSLCLVLAATDAAPTHPNRNDNVEQRKGIIRNQRPRRGLCVRRDWKADFFFFSSALDLSISLMQRRPQIHYKPIIWCLGRGRAGHSLVNCSA